MKQITYIESAEELLNCADKGPRCSDDPLPLLPKDARVMFNLSNGLVTLEAEGFELAPDVTLEEVLQAVMQRCGLPVTLL